MSFGVKKQAKNCRFHANHLLDIACGMLFRHDTATDCTPPVSGLQILKRGDVALQWGDIGVLLYMYTTQSHQQILWGY